MTLTSVQSQALKLLATNMTRAEVASSIGVSKRTFQRWLKLPEFIKAIGKIQTKSAEVAEARIEQTAEIASDYVNRLHSLIPMAVSVIEQGLEDTELRFSDRLKSAQLLGSLVGLDRVAALKQPLQQSKSVAGQEIQEQIERLKQLFAEAYQAGEWSVCLAVLKEQSSLLNLYPARPLDEVSSIASWVDARLLPVEALEKVADSNKIFRQSLQEALMVGSKHSENGNGKTP